MLRRVEGDGAVQRRPVWAGVASLLAVVVVLGLRPVRLWTIEQFPAVALLNGIRMPGPLPALGLPVAAEPSWVHWATRVIGALVIPIVFGLWMSRRAGGVWRVAVQAWVTTVVAVVAGCVVHAVLESMLMAGGFVSFLLLVGGTVLLGALVGIVVGVPVSVVCGVVHRLSGDVAAGPGRADGGVSEVDSVGDRRGARAAE